MTECKCIGCERLAADGLCSACETKLNALEKALSKVGQNLELTEVHIKDE